MYFGPGSTPMLAAAAAWGGLADQLLSTASFYQSVISGLTEEGWLGPASASMAAAVAPYMAWMTLTGAQAEQTAANATAATGAYEVAYATTVPPAVVAANRAQLLLLVATNFLGQNTAAIAATEAEYGEMWAQDAAAMYGYATSAAAASELAPFKQPAQITNPSGQAAQSAAVSQAGNTAASGVQQTLNQLTSALPNALQSLASPMASASPAAGFPTDLWTLLDSNFVNGLISAGYTSPAVIAPGAFAAMADVNAVALGVQDNPVPPMGSGEGNESWLNLPTSGPIGPSGPAAPQAGSTELPSVNLNGFSAGPNQAAMVGRLSVPQSWAAVAQVENHAGVALPGGGWNSNSIPEGGAAGAPGMPGYPIGRAGGSNWGNGPRYGFRLTVMAHPPAAG